MHGPSAQLWILTQLVRAYECGMRSIATVVALLGLWSCVPPEKPELPELPAPERHCGNVLPTQERDAGSGPGWYDFPEEPANLFFGEARLKLVNGTLQGSLTLPPGACPIYLAIKWPGSEPQPITEVIDPSVSTTFSSAPLDCRRTPGTLLAYLLRTSGSTPDPGTDELIGVGVKPLWLFASQQTAFNQPLTEELCRSGDAQLLPLQLQHDPRLTLALCDTADERSELVCGQPPLDRTRIDGISATVEDDGRVRISASFVAFVDEPVDYLVNGVPFAEREGQLDSSLANGPWNSGPNTIQIRQGSLPPWSATVALPIDSLHPRLHEPALREGAQFTVSWDAASWAQSYRLIIAPLDVPISKTSDPEWTSEQPSVSEIFPGFRNAVGGTVLPTRAMLMLTGRASSGFHSIEWNEQIEVAVQP